jgi:hypothetical protein
MSIGASAPPEAPPLPGAITSDHTGGQLDFIRTAILSLQHFAEQTNDDQDLHPAVRAGRVRARGRRRRGLTCRAAP